MAVYDLEEQEQLAEMKAWWAQYGQLISTLVVAVAVASLSWQGWQWYQRKQSAEAAALYSVVQRAAAQNDAAAARQATGQILEKFDATAYAPMAALLSAKVQIAAGDAANAALPLQWVADHAAEPTLRDIARLRLAAIKLGAGELDAAQAALAAPMAPMLGARYHDLRGDVLVAAGKPEEARTAYQAAIDAAGEINAAGDRSVDIIRLKRDALSGVAR
ncbi:MAG: tetratricopeptide repeat protein [Rhodocyclaceae bacterium]|nr:tetratricopeptide repeat protein [Rhodocyclaceae bacterium]